MWALPIAVLVSLTGLLVSIWLIGKVERLNWYVSLSGKMAQVLVQIRTPLEPMKKEL
ncbi:hypothetical protein D3C85_1773840 [compost metagenome]